MDEIKHEQCKKCKCWRLPEEFLNAKGRKLKTCAVCRKNDRKWRENNKEKEKERKKKYREENKEKIRERKKKWRENNKEKVREIEKKYYEKNKEKKKKYYHENKERFKDSKYKRAKKYREENKEKVREQDKKKSKKWIEKHKDRYNCPKCPYKTHENYRLTQHLLICTGELKCSSGEKKIMDTLDDMKIEYEYDKGFEVKNENEKLLRWDFIITYNNKKVFVEYNGAHHYRKVCFGGISPERAEENFKKQQLHDNLKEEYCKNNNYPLLWIHYKDFGEINKIVSKFIQEHTDWDGDNYE
jgi:hypothetical protein